MRCSPVRHAGRRYDAWRWLLTGLVVLAVVPGCTYTQLAPPPSDTAYQPAEPEPPDHFGIEFPVLLEYGRWVHTGPYGWVWSPYIDDTWRPYVHGHWAWTEWGWTWVSYEPYGWAVYHYGHWVFDTIWGWIWVPGYEWFPHRVQWVVYEEYVCWAPLPPAGIFYYSDPWASPIDDIWVVCEPEYFTYANLDQYVHHAHRPAPPRVRQQVVRRSPSVDYIRTRTRGPVQRVNVGLTRVKVGQRELKRMELPDTQRKTVQRYRERTIRKIRSDTAPSRERAVERERIRSEKERRTPDTRGEKTRSKTGQRDKEGRKKTQNEKPAP